MSFQIQMIIDPSHFLKLWYLSIHYKQVRMIRALLLTFLELNMFADNRLIENSSKEVCLQKLNYNLK